ncbi:unnamed protein product [Amoebophrya sp. A25]|nr:unnamed protein product [Amoebophrya sp. A25]|eukprot:GSA25T00021300001.1
MSRRVMGHVSDNVLRGMCRNFQRNSGGGASRSSNRDSRISCEDLLAGAFQDSEDFMPPGRALFDHGGTTSAEEEGESDLLEMQQLQLCTMQLKKSQKIRRSQGRGRPSEASARTPVMPIPASGSKEDTYRREQVRAWIPKAGHQLSQLLHMNEDPRMTEPVGADFGGGPPTFAAKLRGQYEVAFPTTGPSYHVPTVDPANCGWRPTPGGVSSRDAPPKVDLHAFKYPSRAVGERQESQKRDKSTKDGEPSRGGHSTSSCLTYEQGPYSSRQGILLPLPIIAEHIGSFAISWTASSRPLEHTWNAYDKPKKRRQ